MAWSAILFAAAPLFGQTGSSTTGVTAAALGISFVPGSTTTFTLEKNGRTYLVDLATRRVAEVSAPAAAGTARDGAATVVPASYQPPGGAAIFARNCARCHGADGKGISDVGTPDFTDPRVQARLTDAQIRNTIRNGKPNTEMKGWRGRMPDQDIDAVATYVRSLGSPSQSPGGGAPSPSRPPNQAKVYQPGDDWLLSLPTGRRPEAHGFYFNFAHRFALDPAFSGPARGGALAGLDGFSLSSFGFRYGVTKKFSLSAYRSPTFIARPIQLMGAYNLLDESDGHPLNVSARFSVEGQNNFAKNFAESFELILSRSLGRRAQLYMVPTFSLHARKLFQPASFRSSAIPNLPGVNTFSTGFGGAFDVRPSVALVAEVTPTFVNGRPLAIHRPAYGFGIQKKIFRHAFTLGFQTNPGTTVSQRAATRASYLNDPTADKPGGMFISFDLMRQIF